MIGPSFDSSAISIEGCPPYILAGKESFLPSSAIFFLFYAAPIPPLLFKRAESSLRS